MSKQVKTGRRIEQASSVACLKVSSEDLGRLTDLRFVFGSLFSPLRIFNNFGSFVFGSFWVRFGPRSFVLNKIGSFVLQKKEFFLCISPGNTFRGPYKALF
jgi:hypothetical protein